MFNGAENCRSTANLTFNGARNRRSKASWTVNSAPNRCSRANLTFKGAQSRHSRAHLTFTGAENRCSRASWTVSFAPKRRSRVNFTASFVVKRQSRANLTIRLPHIVVPEPNTLQFFAQNIVRGISRIPGNAVAGSTWLPEAAKTSFSCISKQIKSAIAMKEAKAFAKGTERSRHQNKPKLLPMQSNDQCNKTIVRRWISTGEH